MSRPSHDRILFLDALRIFAFASVLVGHKFYDLVLDLVPADGPLRIVGKAMIQLFRYGGAGAVVFFLASGNIITHVLQIEKTGEFLLKRTFRIYPLYITAVLLQASRGPALVMLLVFCYAMVMLMEKPAIQVGRRWLRRIQSPRLVPGARGPAGLT